jgi:hypothetical protein
MNEKPNYYAIIPANVRYDNELKDKAKLLYGEITSLSTKDGYCYASNKYFANLYNVSTTTISLLIKNLVDKGYVESEIIYKEGTKEILNRYLTILNDPIKEKFNTPIKEKFKDNNNLTDSNNNITYSNKNELLSFGELSRVKLTQEEFDKIKQNKPDLYEKAIDKLDTWLATTTKKVKSGSHYAYFKSNSWVWDGLTPKAYWEDL